MPQQRGMVLKNVVVSTLDFFNMTLIFSDKEGETPFSYVNLIGLKSVRTQGGILREEF